MYFACCGAASVDPFEIGTPHIYNGLAAISRSLVDRREISRD